MCGTNKLSYLGRDGPVLFLCCRQARHRADSCRFLGLAVRISNHAGARGVEPVRVAKARLGRETGPRAGQTSVVEAAVGKVLGGQDRVLLVGLKGFPIAVHVHELDLLNALSVRLVQFDLETNASESRIRVVIVVKVILIDTMFDCFFQIRPIQSQRNQFIVPGQNLLHLGRRDRSLVQRSRKGIRWQKDNIKDSKIGQQRLRDDRSHVRVPNVLARQTLTDGLGDGGFGADLGAVIADGLYAGSGHRRRLAARERVCVGC